MGNLKKGEELAVYRRNKKQFKTEGDALDSILKKHPKERKKNLKTAHSEKQWIFKAKSNLN